MDHKGNYRGGRRDPNPIFLDMLRQVVVRLEVVETTQRRGQHIEDVSNE